MGIVKRVRRWRWPTWLGLAVLLTGMAGALWTVAQGQTGLQRQMIDSYYYFDAARSIQQTGLPDISWPQGPVNKFFPGYSYVLALTSALAGQEPHEAWRWLQLGLLFLLGPLTVLLLRGLGLSAAQAFVAGGVAAGNVLILRWSAVPYSELLCLVCLLGQGVLVVWRPESWRLCRQIVFCGLAGLAIATRVEALFFQPIFGVLDWRRARLVTSGLIAPAAWAAAGLGPVWLWTLWASAREAAGGLHYLAEGREEFSWVHYYQKLFTLASTSVRFHQFGSPDLFTHLGFRVLWYFFAAALILTPRGLLGRQALWAWVVVWVYWLGHSFWYFSSERYNLFLVPLFALLLVRMAAWFAMPGRPNEGHSAGKQSIMFWGIVAGILALQLNSWFVILVHNIQINRNYSDRDYQNAAFYMDSPTPGGILTDQAADFAYWQDRPVWFALDVEAFNVGLLQEEADLRPVVEEHDIAWIALRQPAEEYDVFDSIEQFSPQVTVMEFDNERFMWLYALTRE